MRAMPAAAPVSLRDLRVACSQCSLRELCMPVGLDADEVARLDELVSTRRKVKRGEPLFHGGDPFSALYAVRSGFMKSILTSPDGREQVTGFFMTGEILGMDGIGTEHHTCTATALEDTEVCVIPFARIEELAREFKPLQHHFHKVMSRQIVRDQGVMMLLGSMRAEERLATFLLNLSRRLSRRGFSSSEFILRTTREEIGSYLGMKLETVSRLFSHFQEQGLIEVQQKHIRILDPEGLQAIVGSHAA
jgi:CRP/FNR family transcriptional regulator